MSGKKVAAVVIGVLALGGALVSYFALRDPNAPDSPTRPIPTTIPKVSTSVPEEVVNEPDKNEDLPCTANCSDQPPVISLVSDRCQGGTNGEESNLHISVVCPSCNKALLMKQNVTEQYEISLKNSPYCPPTNSGKCDGTNVGPNYPPTNSGMRDANIVVGSNCPPTNSGKCDDTNVGPNYPPTNSGMRDANIVVGSNCPTTNSGKCDDTNVGQNYPPTNSGMRDANIVVGSNCPPTNSCNCEASITNSPNRPSTNSKQMEQKGNNMETCPSCDKEEFQMIFQECTDCNKNNK